MPKFSVTVFICAAFAAAALLSPSLAAGAAAAALPQIIAFSFYRARAPKAPFAFWAVKFSLTFLLLALSLRALHESGLLAAPHFIAGVVLAVMLNILLSARVAVRCGREG